MDPITAVSFVSVVWSLVDYGTKVVQRLNEFRANVRDLPQAFLHISDQLPLLIDTVNRLHDQAKDGDLSPKAETALRPVVKGIHAQVTQLDAILVKVLPSAKASTWEKGLKAVKSVAYQKTVDDFASVIDRYVSNLTVYQTTHNGDLIKNLINSIERTSSQQPQPVQIAPSRKPYFMVRYQTDEDFIGRQKIMEEIERRFGRKNRVAITGIGGVGYVLPGCSVKLLWIISINTNHRKSRIAIEYCYQYRGNNPDAHVFWVHCGSRARFEAAYQAIARTMKMPGFENPKINTLQLVSDWLSDQDNGSWLMVLDNADDSEVWIGPAVQESLQEDNPQQSAPLIDYIPRGYHGFVLITSRDGQLGKRLANVKEKPIDILRFTPTDAETLLRSKVLEEDEISEEDVKEITKALDYLPLAITQAAAYLDQNNIPVAKYLQLFRGGKANTSDLLKKGIHDPGRDYEIQNSVFQTWKISFSQISAQDPRAAEALSLMAVLDRQAISENLLRRDGEPELEFTAAIQKLKAFSMITEETEASIFSMHRLVQLSTQKWLDNKNELSIWQEAALSALVKCCPSNGSYENWALLEAMSPHFQVVLDYQFSTKSCRLQCAKILNALGWYNDDQGRYSIAFYQYSESLAVRERHLGLERPETLDSMNNLALVLYRQGKYDEAEEMHQRKLKISKKVLGLEHPDTLTSMNNLASVLARQGKYDEAGEMHRQALESREKVLGLEHPDTLSSVYGLAYLLQNRKQYDDASILYQRACQGYRNSLGPNHPTTLACLEHHSSLLQEMK
jgi:tetratricopeptide (TPR) repeat protein